MLGRSFARACSKTNPSGTINVAFLLLKISFASNHFMYAKDIPQSLERKHMNMFTAINSALDVALASDKT